jgi:pilus assembly protein CpaC
LRSDYNKPRKTVVFGAGRISPPDEPLQGSASVFPEELLAPLIKTRTLSLLVCLFWLPSLARAQAPPSPTVKISGEGKRLEMTVNTSRILALEKSIPRLFVNNPDIVQVTPLSENQVQVSALNEGVTQLNLWDTEGKIYSVDIVVLRDATELTDLLKTAFPEATLRVRPLAEGVYISGYIPTPDMVDEIIALAEDYFPKVINGITVGGVHQVALYVKVMEASRSKLRELGLDWQVTTEKVESLQGAAGLMAQARNADGEELVPGIGGDTWRWKVFLDGDLFIGHLQALRQHNLVKLLAEPTLVAETGRPASFNVGGSFPVLVPSGLGAATIEWREYGTRIDFVPIVLGNGDIRLQVRPRVSEIDESRGVDANGVRVPAVTERYADTSVVMRAGQTLALAGLIQNRVESENKGIPFLADLPCVGRAFSRVGQRVNEVELLIVVTPEIVGAMEPHQIPRCGPGELTVPPSDTELYGDGYLEVPNCCLDPGYAVRQPSDPQVPTVGGAVPGQPVVSRPTVPPRQPELLPTPVPDTQGFNPSLQGTAAQGGNFTQIAVPDSGRWFYGPMGYDPID